LARRYFGGEDGRYIPAGGTTYTPVVDVAENDTDSYAVLARATVLFEASKATRLHRK
jgi:hypothetical protein